jgi:hypothetical protein
VRGEIGYRGFARGITRWMRSAGAGWRVTIRCWAEKSWDVSRRVLHCKDRAAHARLFS